MLFHSAKFSIGQIVRHNLYGYRGVIVDVDATYQREEAWYKRMARSRPPKDKPWYRILVHDSESESYVAQRNLTLDPNQEPVKNPLLNFFFENFNNGIYSMLKNMH